MSGKPTATGRSCNPFPQILSMFGPPSTTGSCGSRCGYGNKTTMDVAFITSASGRDILDPCHLDMTATGVRLDRAVLSLCGVDVGED